MQTSEKCKREVQELCTVNAGLILFLPNPTRGLWDKVIIFEKLCIHAVGKNLQIRGLTRKFEGRTLDASEGNLLDDWCSIPRLSTCVLDSTCLARRETEKGAAKIGLPNEKALRTEKMRLPLEKTSSTSSAPSSKKVVSEKTRP